MPSYLHPGVYIEEIPSGAKAIEAVGTSTAAFVGYTTRGPLGRPELLFNFDQYRRLYGGVRDLGAGADGDAMGFSVRAFFQNGGGKAYVVRLADDTEDEPLAAARGVLRHPADADSVIELTAVDPGTWADHLFVAVAPKPGDPQLHRLTIGRKRPDRDEIVAEETFADVSLDPESPRFLTSAVDGVSRLITARLAPADETDPPAEYLLGTSVSDDLAGVALDLGEADEDARTLRVALDGGAATDVVLPAADFTGDLGALAAAIESGVRAPAPPARAGFVARAHGSRLVLISGTRSEASAVSATGDAAATLRLGEANGGVELTGAESRERRLDSGEAELLGGADGDLPADERYEEVFTAFLKVRDVNILCLPGKAWDDDGRPAIEAAIAHAERTQSRMVIVDPPAGRELVTEQQVTALGLPTSTYSVLYYPWPRVANPFYDEEDNPGVPVTLRVPPSGFAAGQWARIDGRRGVWKAPAGVEARLLGLEGLEHVVEDAEQDQLNPLGVNALRRLPGFGPVIWGSRTLSTRANPEWRYVPVRRTAIFIERSIYEGIQWAVFEPNDHRLWSSLRLNIDSFMNGLFRSGAFQGEKASDAYFVRCNLGDTMTQGDIDRGQVIVIVGFAPLKPAEFVIVRIQQKVAQQ